MAQLCCLREGSAVHLSLGSLRRPALPLPTKPSSRGTQASPLVETPAAFPPPPPEAAGQSDGSEVCRTAMRGSWPRLGWSGQRSAVHIANASKQLKLVLRYPVRKVSHVSRPSHPALHHSFPPRPVDPPPTTRQLPPLHLDPWGRWVPGPGRGAKAHAGGAA